MSGQHRGPAPSPLEGPSTTPEAQFPWLTRSLGRAGAGTSVDLVLSWGPSLQPVRSLLPPGPGSLHLGVCVVPSLLLQVPIEGLGVLSPPVELVRSKHLDCLGAVLGKGCPQGLPLTESPSFWSGCPSAPPLCSEPASRLWSVSFASPFFLQASQCRPLWVGSKGPVLGGTHPCFLALDGAAGQGTAAPYHSVNGLCPPLPETSREMTECPASLTKGVFYGLFLIPPAPSLPRLPPFGVLL